VNVAIHLRFGEQAWTSKSEFKSEFKSESKSQAELKSERKFESESESKSKSEFKSEPTLAPEAFSDTEIIRRVLAGETERFGVLVTRHQTRLFALARRYLRREEDVADLVQDVLVKAFSRLDSWRGQAPFEHWLMRMATRACLDALRSQRRQREESLSDLSVEENEWLDRHAASPDRSDHHAEAARSLVRKVFEQLSPAHRLVLTLLELEDRSVKEISKITGWSQTLVKVRAFRARAEMKRVLSRLQTDTFL
jgi:RNA polymerase sigma-70 factor (ECF subfamily)